MNQFGLLIVCAILAAIVFAVAVGLNYFYAAILFSGVAMALAPVAVHKIPESNVATGLLVGLGVFAAYPIRKLFQLDSLIASMLVTLACVAALWVIGLGWKRSWKQQ